MEHPTNTLPPKIPVVLAMPLMPYQAWTEVYDLPVALKEGTLFPDLNLPFFMGGADYEG